MRVIGMAPDVPVDFAECLHLGEGAAFLPTRTPIAGQAASHESQGEVMSRNVESMSGADRCQAALEFE